MGWTQRQQTPVKRTVGKESNLVSPAAGWAVSTRSSWRNRAREGNLPSPCTGAMMGTVLLLCSTQPQNPGFINIPAKLVERLPAPAGLFQA